MTTKKGRLREGCAGFAEIITDLWVLSESLELVWFLESVSGKYADNLESKLISKTSTQLEADYKELLATNNTLEKVLGGASKELVQKSNDISQALGLISDEVKSNSVKLQTLSDGIKNIQEAMNIQNGLYPSSNVLKSYRKQANYFDVQFSIHLTWSRRGFHPSRHTNGTKISDQNGWRALENGFWNGKSLKPGFSVKMKTPAGFLLAMEFLVLENR